MSANGPLAIEVATAADAPAIAEIRLSARRVAMPWLKSPHSEDETRAWLARVVGSPPGDWRIARDGRGALGYLWLIGERLEHLYVRPVVQREGVGSALMAQARALSQRRLELRAFRNNSPARRFYEKQGFAIEGFTDGDNEEREPDVIYVWRGLP